MSRITVTVALLLISGLVGEAAAQDGLKDPSNKGRKLTAYLETIGVNNPKIIGFIQTANQRVEGRYLRLTEHRFENSRIVLHYKMEPKISTRQFELKFQPDNYNGELVATTRSVMMRYKYTF